MYNDVNTSKAVQCYMEALEINSGAPASHWEDNKICIYIFEAKRVTPRVKHIDITVFFIQEQRTNGLSIPK